MPIRPPALDDRTYDDLVAELLQRIPAHTPEWSSPRVGDPGRTLIELFAWLGDALLYRVNLVPERQRLKFLSLLGQPLRAARPARGLVSISPRNGGALAVPEGVSLVGSEVCEGRTELNALPLAGAAFVKRPVARDEVPIELEALAEFHNLGDAVAGYSTSGLFADGSVEIDVFHETVDGCLWLALLARPEENQVAANRAAVDAARGQLINIGFEPTMPSPDPLEPMTARPAVPHVWEVAVHTGSKPVDVDHPWQPEYLAVEADYDTTAGLTQRGVIRLRLPAQDVLHAPTNDVREDPDAGVGERPPRIDDEAVAARLVGWLRLRGAASTASHDEDVEPVPEFVTGGGADNPAGNASRSAVEGPAVRLGVRWVGTNAVEVEQLVTRTNLILGESTGAADQEFDLPANSVEAGTLVIQVDEAEGERAWLRVDDLGSHDLTDPRSGEARVYELDAEAGRIRFGDGVRGRIPPIGRRVIVRQMRSGGGLAGNLPAGSLKSVVTALDENVLGSQLVVDQPLPLVGGSDAETVDDAEKRIPARLWHRERAVTPDDYRAIVRETPGVAVGRVELLPHFKPQQRHEGIPGVVTVMALPQESIAPAPNPRADRLFLETIHGWLDARRPVGTELYVIGCEYVPIAVSVAVSIAPEAPIDATMREIRQALVRVLWPLAPGGFDGEGWPLGRELSNRELAVEVARVAGVSEVAGLNLFARKSTTATGASGVWERVGDARDGKEQNLGLAGWQLPELLGVTVVEGDSAPLVLDLPDPTAGSELRPLTVPIVPDCC